MRNVLAALLVVGSVCAIGCGGSSPASGGSGGVGNRGSGGAGAMGGAGVAGFHLVGHVQQPLAALATDGDSDEVVADAISPKIVTHVLAVNPSSQNPARVLAPVAPDGSFSLSLDPGHAWVLVFVDTSRIGQDMIAGIFRASTLDTVAPTAPGSGDLGMVEVAGDGSATAGISYPDLLAALHLSTDDAEFLGAADDVCLRYVNPDIDGDGVLDLRQPGHDFRLDFHVQFGMRAASAAGGGANATVADIVGNFLPDGTGISFGGVGIYASQQDTFGPVSAANTWASFEEPVTYYPGGSNPTPVTAPAGTRVSGSDLIFLGYSGYQSEGVYAAAGANLPQGRYQFGVGTGTMTFTNVHTHTDAELQAASNFILPFIRFVPTDTACTGACALSAVEYRWMKRTDAGWIPATPGELALVVGEAGGYISIVKALDSGTQHIGFIIPATNAAGSLPWSSASLEGLTAADLANTTSDQICHLGLSYDDKLGMRMFAGIANAPGTCL